MQQLHDVLSVLSKPPLQTLRLQLVVGFVVVPSGSDLQVQDVVSDADTNQYKDLHAVLARPVSDRLTNATIILISRGEAIGGAVPKEGLPPDLLAFLRMLFAPWCRMRGHTSFLSGSRGRRSYASVVSACSDEEVCWLAGQAKKDAEEHL